MSKYEEPMQMVTLGLDAINKIVITQILGEKYIEISCTLCDTTHICDGPDLSTIVGHAVGHLVARHGLITQKDVN